MTNTNKARKVSELLRNHEQEHLPISRSELAYCIDTLVAEVERPSKGAVEPPEQFCYCGSEISLQLVSGGAAPEGLYGRVTLKVKGIYVDYFPASALAALRQENERLKAMPTISESVRAVKLEEANDTLRQENESANRVAAEALQANVDAMKAWAQERTQLAEAQAENERLREKLVECRSSVKSHINEFDRFMMRKEPHANKCDRDEQIRLYDLLNWIDDNAALKGDV